MHFYRFYTLDQAGGIRLADWIRASDDTDAVEKARQIAQGARMCEIWLSDRLVAVLRDRDLVVEVASRPVQT